jgi:hypothetical protein
MQKTLRALTISSLFYFSSVSAVERSASEQKDSLDKSNSFSLTGISQSSIFQKLAFLCSS